MIYSEGFSSLSNHFDELHKCKVFHWIKAPLKSGRTHFFFKNIDGEYLWDHDVTDIVDSKTVAP